MLGQAVLQEEEEEEEEEVGPRAAVAVGEVGQQTRWEANFNALPGRPLQGQQGRYLSLRNTIYWLIASLRRPFTGVCRPCVTMNN